MTVRGRIMAAALAAGTALVPLGAGAQGLAGPYLAAASADLNNDYDIAARYYARALERDRESVPLLQSALVAMIAAGDFERAGGVADRLIALDPENQIAALTELATALRDGAHARAAEIAGDDAYRLNPLLAGLAEGWAHVGAGDYDAAIAAFDGLDGNDTLATYGRFHKALALALAGDYASAAELLDGEEDAPLHVNRAAVMAHIASLSQADRIDDARAVAEQALSDGFSDPGMEAARDRLAAGEPVPFDVIDDASDGAAMVFSIIGSALARDNADRFALVYARLATLIWPEFEEARILVAEVLHDQGQYALAIDAFSEIGPESPWFISAEIGRAEALQRADRPEQAIEVLASLARERPGQLSVLTSLGDVHRTNENWLEADDAYTRALDTLEEERPSHWVLHYYRGIARERSDQWPEAEADFRRALELNPDQPLVLNYLGYSLVELRQNLDEALEMIETAVEQRPEDGYITDSLGWVLYRLGRYEEAVPHMERAVELAPIDPIINDHLGDVLWMVGRELEARFQWRRALSFEPEPEEAERIRRKLEVGLDRVLAEEEAAEGETPAATAQDDG